MNDMGIPLRPRYGITLLAIWAAFFPVALLAAQAGAPTDCKGPEELEANVQARPDADSYTNLGTWFGENNQYACASKAFTAALKLNPASAKLNYFLGLSLFPTGDIDGATAALKESIRLDANAAQPRLLLANILHQQGRRADAEAQWRAVLQIDAESKPALDGLANSLMDNGDARIAIHLLQPVKRDEDLTIDLARAYGLAGLLDQAAATLQAALSAAPSSFGLTNALTTVFVQQHRYQDAAALMQKYTQQHPDDVDAEIAYLSALVLNSDWTTARPLGQALLVNRADDFNVLYLNGIIEREGGDYATARGHLLEAVRLQPENYSARFNLGTTLAHLNDAAGAKEQLQKALSLDASQSQAHFQLAAVLRTLGDTAGSQEQLRIYKQLSNESTARSQSDTKARMAAEKLGAGDAKQAAALYKEAVDATPDNAMLQYQMSIAMNQSGDATGERAALEAAVKIDPTFALAQNQLGYLEGRAGESADAEKHFRLAVAAAPTFTDAWINLAATLAQETRMADAQQAVTTALQLEPNNAQALQLSQKLNEAAHHP